MSKLNFTISVDDDDIPDRIRKSLKGGMRDAADELLDAGEKTAKNTIQKRGRVWRRELMSSFTRENEGAGGSRRAVLRNVATHAGPVEHGAVYGARGPPISALIPWVLSKWNPGSGDSSDGGSSKSPETRSRQFSENRKLRSPSETKNYSRISDEIWTTLDVTEVNHRDQLSYSDAETLQMQLEMHSDLDTSAVNTVVGDIKSWKEDSNPARNNRVPRYAELTRLSFGIEGDARGDFDGTLSQDEVDVLRILNELTRTHFRENVTDGNDSVTLHRGLTRETGRLTKEMIDNPSADSWELDVNAIDNYTMRRGRTDMFDRGLLVTKDANLNEDITISPDYILPTRNRGELEVHLRGGNGTRFGRDEAFFVIYDADKPGPDIGKEYVPMADILDKIQFGGFESFDDAELLAFNRIIRQMDRYDISVSTPAGQQRLGDFRDVFVDRGLTSRVSASEQHFIDMINGLM